MRTGGSTVWGDMNSTKNKSSWEKAWPKAWNGFWKPLLLTGGTWSERKIRNELHDLVFVVDQVSEVYCYITGSQLSKPMYYAETIKTAYDDSITEAAREEAVERIGEALDEIQAEIEVGKSKKELLVELAKLRKRFGVTQQDEELKKMSEFVSLLDKHADEKI